METQKKKQSCHCIHLRRAANNVSAHYDSHLAPLNITINQFSLLENLEKLGSGSVSDLAKKIKLERTTLVRTLKPLIERGLVQDMADPSKRKRNLTLTDTGHQLIQEGKSYWETAQHEMESQLTKEELQLFLTLIKKLERY